LVYTPSNITANVGDVVAFFFNPKNHTVTQSNFAQPCLTLEESTGKVGLDSGFTHPTNVSQTDVGFNFTVNDTAPLWFHCEQLNHCKQGMVFAVNANENKTFDAYLNNALNSNSSSSTPSGSSGGSTATATGTGTGASEAASSTGTSSPSNGNGAISTSVNVGLAGVFAVAGGFILAL
jgi:plastocyanin